MSDFPAPVLVALVLLVLYAVGVVALIVLGCLFLPLE